MAGRRDCSVESAEGAAIRLEVRNEACLEEGIFFGAIGRHDDLIRKRGKTLDHALDEGTSEEGLEGFVRAHAGGCAASLYTNSEHGCIIFAWQHPLAICWIN